jgi:hypothetical protein
MVFRSPQIIFLTLHIEKDKQLLLSVLGAVLSG